MFKITTIINFLFIKVKFLISVNKIRGLLRNGKGQQNK